ncbi:MAG TPA: hypothetical protein VFQ53_02170 [Kofleriaceae bacterium]|nr:hypothetical protein [Kofleriaceae bacterium]
MPRPDDEVSRLMRTHGERERRARRIELGCWIAVLAVVVVASSAVPYAWLAAVAAIPVGWKLHVWRARRDRLRAIAEALHGERSSDGIRGSCQDVPLSLHYTDDATELQVELPAAYPLAIHIRARGLFARRAEPTEIALGDRAFDERFVLEAAPADVVRVLLDDAARRYLGALDDRHGDLELSTTADDDGRLLVLTLRGRVDAVAATIELVHGATRIATRIRDAYAATEAAAPQVTAGAPYRPELVEAPPRDHQAEVDWLEAERAARAGRWGVWDYLGVGFVTALVGKLVLLLV